MGCVCASLWSYCQSMPSGFSFRKWADVKRGQKLYRQFYQTLHQELRSKNFHFFPSMFFDIPGMASYKLGLAESSPELLEDCSHVAKELDALGCLWRRFCGAWLVTGSWPEVQCSFFLNLFLVTKRFNEEHPIIHGKSGASNGDGHFWNTNSPFKNHT